MNKAKEYKIGFVETRGRKTKYDDRFCDISEYLQNCSTAKNLPSIKGYGLYLGVGHQTVVNWQKVNKDFKHAMQTLKALSEEILVNGGLSKTYNPIMAKFILASRHEFRERTDVTSDNKVVKGVVFLPKRAE
jgi:hypothetical protein